MAKTVNDVITIMRRIVGENDGNDPDATNDIFLEYINNFLRLQMGQDVVNYDLYGYFEFTTVADTEDYDFKDQGYIFITPPIYAIDSNDSETIINYFQNVADFFSRHPITQQNEDTGRPADLLFYNDSIKLRPVPDGVYTIKMKAYKELATTDLAGTDEIAQDYYYRYVAYGASLDYLADFGNYEDYQAIYPIYQRYRSIMLKRTAKQMQTQRPKPAL